jgi:uncharacterized repeat protein (TIGR01451 family)
MPGLIRQAHFHFPTNNRIRYQEEAMSAIHVPSSRRLLMLALVTPIAVAILLTLLSLLNAATAQGSEPTVPPTHDLAPSSPPSPPAPRAALPTQPLQQAARSTAATAALPAADRSRPHAVDQDEYARANIAWDAVDGQFGAGVKVQYTVYDHFGAFKGKGEGTAASDGWLNGIGCDCDIAPGDEVEVTSDAGFHAVLLPIPIDGQIDVAADEVSGQMDKAVFPATGGIWVWSQFRDQGAWLAIDIQADGKYTADFSAAVPPFDIQQGDQAEVWYFQADHEWVGTMLYTPRVDAELWFSPGGHSNMWGRAEAGAALTIRTPTAEVHTVADENRNWRAPDIGPLQPGDDITIDVAGLPSVQMPVPDPFDAQADSATDTVWGQIGGRYNKPVEIHGDWDGGYQEVTTDPAGHFTAAFDDVPRGAQGYIRWTAELAAYAGAIYHRPFQTSDLTVRVDYFHEDVYGYYETGHNVWVTVTDSSDAVKATASATTAPIPWEPDRIGFQIPGDEWVPDRPDIEPGDWVHVSVDDGESTDVHVGAVTGHVNVSSDSVSGQINVPWFTQDLSIQCHPWQGAPDNTPGKESTAGPDGDPSYLCQWDPDTEWDIVPGNTVGVWYIGSDANWVGNGFYEPAPNLEVQTWPAGGGEAAAGGRAVFQIQYHNRGDVTGDAVLTATLPAGVTYVADSSGLTPDVLGNQVVWDVGSVQPMTAPHLIQLVVNNTLAAGAKLHIAVDIAAQYDMEWGDNHAEAEVGVSSGSPDLYVNADSSPGDPTPGQLLRYNINFGNNGPVASGLACLTETIPEHTTFVSIEPQSNYQLWKLISSVGRVLEFCADSVPGKWGGELYLNLRLDAGVPYDTQLVNRVEIETAGDSDPDNNVHVNDWTYVRQPRTESAVYKSWGHGSLAVGGVANYWVRYRNEGNVPLHNLVLTDTLPAGTTFVTSVLDAGWGVELPFPPDEINGRQLVWRVGDLDVNEGEQFLLRLLINPDTKPGTLLSNCATLAGSEFEYNPYENDQCADETARAAGPNLRVQKFSHWEGPNRLYFGVRIGNIGTTKEHDVVVTDTFPEGLTLSDWGVDSGGNWDWNLTGNQFTVTFDELEMGGTRWLNLWLDVPDVANGTLFTNNAEITIPSGDVNPADNSDTLVVGTGPDLSVRKWQSGGPSRPEPGDLVTFTLHLENHAQAWGTAGDVWITDTLPAGLEFVSARERLCEGYFCPRDPDRIVGNAFAWSFGTLGNNNWRDLEITALVADTVHAAASLLNTATTRSTDPGDVEPNYADNTSSFTVRVAGAIRYLPLILR